MRGLSQKSSVELRGPDSYRDFVVSPAEAGQVV